MIVWVQKAPGLSPRFSSSLAPACMQTEALEEESHFPARADCLHITPLRTHLPLPAANDVRQCKGRAYEDFHRLSDLS